MDILNLAFGMLDDLKNGAAMKFDPVTIEQPLVLVQPKRLPDAAKISGDKLVRQRRAKLMLRIRKTRSEEFITTRDRSGKIIESYQPTVEQLLAWDYDVFFVTETTRATSIAFFSPVDAQGFFKAYHFWLEDDIELGAMRRLLSTNLLPKPNHGGYAHRRWHGKELSDNDLRVVISES